MKPRLGLVLLLGLTAWVRLPAVLNARAMTSDGAIVGVQALRILEGHLSLHLAGAAYQSSAEAFLAAGLFALFGPSPFALVMVPFLGMLALVALVWRALARGPLGTLGALWCTLPLAVGSIAVNLPMMTVVRQLMILTAVAGALVLNGAPTARKPALRFFCGAGLAGLAVSVDTFALSLAPAVALLGALALWEARSLRSLVAVAGAGALSLLAALAMGHLGTGPGALMARRVAPNASLLWHEVLPFTFGVLDEAPWPVRVAQVAAAAVFVVLTFSSLALGWRRTLPAELRRLGVLGGVGALAAVVLFLFSTAPVDRWATRYLAPMIWLSPFALAPVAARLGPKRLATLLLPYLASAAVASWLGWLHWGPWVEGPVPVLSARGRADDERALRQALAARGVDAVAAPYWLAYRLSLLFENAPVVVPTDPAQDRLPEHRARFEAARTVALVFHPTEEEAPGPRLEALRREGAQVTQEEIAGFTVLVWRR